jgi:hypothetical protein
MNRERLLRRSLRSLLMTAFGPVTASEEAVTLSKVRTASLLALLAVTGVGVIPHRVNDMRQNRLDGVLEVHILVPCLGSAGTL